MSSRMTYCQLSFDSMPDPQGVDSGTVAGRLCSAFIGGRISRFYGNFGLHVGVIFAASADGIDKVEHGQREQ